MKNILFLCTGNACRSQIAEGWARHFANGDFDIQSAGIVAHGQNPRAIKTMAAVGIDITTQTSTQLTEHMLAKADVLVTVCGHADSNCPPVSDRIQKIHWPLDDPAQATGREIDIAAVFNATRDDIKSRVDRLISSLV